MAVSCFVSLFQTGRDEAKRSSPSQTRRAPQFQAGPGPKGSPARHSPAQHSPAQPGSPWAPAAAPGPWGFGLSARACPRALPTAAAPQAGSEGRAEPSPLTLPRPSARALSPLAPRAGAGGCAGQDPAPRLPRARAAVGWQQAGRWGRVRTQTQLIRVPLWPWRRLCSAFPRPNGDVPGFCKKSLRSGSRTVVWRQCFRF